MKKITIFFSLILMIFIASCGGKEDLVLPTFEELAKANQYSEIFKTYSNMYAKAVSESEIETEDYIEETIFIKSEGKIDYHTYRKLNSSEEYFSCTSRTGNVWYHQEEGFFFTALEIGEKYFFDYTLSNIFDISPIGITYLEGDYIVAHAYDIKLESEFGEACRYDITMYFNKETKLLEKSMDNKYNAYHELVSTSVTTFEYDVEKEITKTLYSIVNSSENKIELEIIVDNNTNEQKTYAMISNTDAMLIVAINEKFYSLYLDAEYQNELTNLQDYKGQQSLTLYAKEQVYE